MASTVILLLSGPTAMNASSEGSRAISAIWLVANWVTATLSGSMPDSVRMTRSNVTLACVRPITPMRCPAQSVQRLDLRRRLLLALGRKPGRRPQHDDVLAQDGDRLGIGRQVQVAARHRKIGLAGAEQRDALVALLGRDRRQPDRAALARKGLRHRLDQFLVLAAGRPDRNSQRRRPQHVIQRARGDAEHEHARGEDQKRIVLALPSRAGWCRIVVCV